MTAGGSSIPEAGALLRVLAAARRRAAEAGTAFGVGAAAIAAGLPPGATLVTVEIDPERARIARDALAAFDNVRLIEGDWRQELPPYAPFDLLFLDPGGWRDEVDEVGPFVLSLLEIGGLAVIDDMTPGRRGADPVRDFWLGDPRVAGVEILTTPSTAAVIATRVS